MPLTRNATQRAAFSTGSVKVRRLVFSFSTQLAITSRDFSCRPAVPGNSDAVCPSGPMPRRIKSKTWNLPGLQFEKLSQSLFVGFGYGCGIRIFRGIRKTFPFATGILDSMASSAMR